MAFAPERLREALGALPPASRYWVALSGGLDSTVLLHALAALSLPAAAVHVDHGWHPESARWAEQCAALCAALGIAYTAVRIDCRPARGESREAAARRERYAALRERVGTGEMLLTAHHRDDQAETLLLQLFRGSGPRGLAAMPAVAPFGAGWHGRPLLGVPRDALVEYARTHGLVWIDDPSNFDTAFDRNLLRHELLPPLLARWPGLARTLARAAAHMGEAAELLDELAAADLLRSQGRSAGTLSVAALGALAPAHARNLLRYWLRRLGLPLPGSAQLERALGDLLNARPDAEPRIAWPGAELRRYRDGLYAMAPLPPIPDAPLRWSTAVPLTIAALGVLTAIPGSGPGLRRDLAELEVRFRQGGESCRPLGRRESHRLKQLYQEAGVPPWVRRREPLLYCDGRLCAVADRFVCEEFAAKPGEASLTIEWRR